MASVGEMLFKPAADILMLLLELEGMLLPSDKSATGSFFGLLLLFAEPFVRVLLVAVTAVRVTSLALWLRASVGGALDTSVILFKVVWHSVYY